MFCIWIAATRGILLEVIASALPGAGNYVWGRLRFQSTLTKPDAALYCRLRQTDKRDKPRRLGRGSLRCWENRLTSMRFLRSHAAWPAALIALWSFLVDKCAVKPAFISLSLFFCSACCLFSSSCCFFLVVGNSWVLVLGGHTILELQN